jgi:hypothetical protein
MQTILFIYIQHLTYKMHVYKTKEFSYASYDEIKQNMKTHQKLKHIYDCSKKGTSFFIYKGLSRKVLTVLNGEIHVVPINNNNKLLQINTKPGIIYIFGYTL